MLGAGLPRLIGIILLLAAYFLPALLAWRKRHPLRRRLLVANALFGWTIVGWLVCLMVALNRRLPGAAWLRRHPS
ncbi:superinfection immunity protein [Ferrovibrio sp.]|uniref:superinfection immunity protein n=1 Tax=Ferrovibrio sp. TaxID=1917215 RepID=UPI00311DECFE